MTDWLIFAGMAIFVFAILAWPVRLGQSALMLVAAALFVAAAGYAWQGQPGLAGAPAGDRALTLQPDTIFVSERMRFLDHYGETGIVLGTADAFHRADEDEAAAGLLANAVADHPGSVDLRIGYAQALLLLAKGHLTPAVELAFDRAQQVARAGNPAPAYFRGLAALEVGDAVDAERRWRELAGTLPAGSPWAAPLAQRIDALAMMGARLPSRGS